MGPSTWLVEDYGSAASVMMPCRGRWRSCVAALVMRGSSPMTQLEEANAPNGFDASGAVRVRYCRGSPHDTDDAHRAEACGQAGGQQGKERDAHAEDGDRPLLGQHVVEGGLPAGRLLESRRRRQVVWQGAGQRHRALQRWRVLDERGAPRRLRTAWRRVVLGDEEGEGEEGCVIASLVIPRSAATRDLLLAERAVRSSYRSRKRCALAPTPLAPRSGSARIARATPNRIGCEQSEQPSLRSGRQEFTNPTDCNSPAAFARCTRRRGPA